MNEDARTPRKPLAIKDRVVVRDDSKMSAATMLGALIAVMLIGAALLYGYSGDGGTTASVNAPTTERSAPDSTTGQGGTNPAAPGR